jgi:hypothetical protein
MLRKFGTGMLIVAAAAACGDATGPEDFDPVDTQQKADVVLAAFDTPALLSLGALQNLDIGAGPLLSATMPATPPAFATPARAAHLRALAQAAPSFSSASPAVIFPADLLGATFVWDAEQNRYVVDPEATGAPSNGIRVTLYTVNPILHLPTLPLDARGYVDLIDESTPAADALHIVAVWEDVTHLDYVASATTISAPPSATLSAEGYVSDGTDRVDFALSLTASASGIAINYQLTHDDGSIRLTGNLSNDDESDLPFTDVTLTVSDGDNEVVLTLTVGPSTFSGTIEYNGDVAVEIGGTVDAPTFTRPDGTPLTEAEIAALEAFGDLINAIVSHFDDLLGPALLLLFV